MDENVLIRDQLQIEEEFAFLHTLSTGGPAEWSIEQIARWVECRCVCHHEYARAAMRRLIDENARLTASLIDYWGEFGAVAADNGKFKARLDEAEKRGRAAERKDVLWAVADHLGGYWGRSWKAALRSLQDVLTRGAHEGKGGARG